MAVLAALDLSLATTAPIPRGSDHDPERRDYAVTFTDLVAKKDFEFAIKMLTDYASASLKAGRPLLQSSPQLKDPNGLRHWRESPTTLHTASTKPPRPGPDTSGPSKSHGCQPSPTGASANAAWPQHAHRRTRQRHLRHRAPPAQNHAVDAVDLAFNKYVEHSIPLAATRNNTRAGEGSPTRRRGRQPELIL